MIVKRALILAILFFAMFFVSGCSGGGIGGLIEDGLWVADMYDYFDDDSYDVYEDNPVDPSYPVVPVAPAYAPYVAVLDSGNDSMILINRNSIDGDSPDVQEVPIDPGARTVAYCNRTGFMYVGCEGLLLSVYMDGNFSKYGNEVDGSALVASDFSSVLFGSYGSAGLAWLDCSLYGEVSASKNANVDGSPEHAAVSPFGAYAAVSGVCGDGTGVVICETDTGLSRSVERAGNRGLDVTGDGTVFSVLFDGSGFTLNKSSFDGGLSASIDLSTDMYNPWGVACVEYQDGKSEVFVTDCSEDGGIFVYNADDLSYAGRLGVSCVCPKHISRSPEGDALYAVVQGYEDGGDAALLKIDPSLDVDSAVVAEVDLGGVSGSVLEGLAVMPYEKDWDW